MASWWSSLSPTYKGHIASTRDALILFEACLVGEANHVARPPSDHERLTVAMAGNVFVYEDQSSGIRNWTDGLEWDPPRPVGNFLLYRQLARVPSPSPDPDEQHTGKNGHRQFNGIFDPRGLCKSTITVTVRGISHHLVAYFTIKDVLAGELTTPGTDQRFHDLVPRPELLCQDFPVPVEESFKVHLQNLES